MIVACNFAGEEHDSTVLLVARDVVWCVGTSLFLYNRSFENFRYFDFIL